jgi:hypothetical protein
VWSPQIQKGVCRLPTYSGILYSFFRFYVHDCHVLWSRIPPSSIIVRSPMLRSYNPDRSRFGLFPVRSSLTKGISCDLFSSRYLDISVPQVFLLRSKSVDSILFGMEGYPIRTPPDRSFLTAPRRLSRSSASFFVQTSQGIHYMLEFT